MQMKVTRKEHFTSISVAAVPGWCLTLAGGEWLVGDADGNVHSMVLENSPKRLLFKF